MEEKEKTENEDSIKEYGQLTLDENREEHKIHLLSIIG